MSVYISLSNNHMYSLVLAKSAVTEKCYLQECLLANHVYNGVKVSRFIW